MPRQCLARATYLRERLRNKAAKPSAEFGALIFEERCDSTLLLRRHVRGDAGRKFFQCALCCIRSAPLDVPECRDILIEQ